MPAATDLERAVELVLATITADPAAAKTLLPGFVIVARPSERRVHLPKARLTRAERFALRRDRIHELIARQRATDPAITEAELAQALNDAELTTYNGYAFTISRLKAFLRKHPT